MPNLSPFVVVISLGQQIRGLAKGRPFKARNYWGEEEDEEEEEDGGLGGSIGRRMTYSW